MPLIDYKAEEYKILLEIARAITARLDLTHVLKLVIRHAVEIVGGEVGLIALRRADAAFEFAAHFGIDAHMLPYYAPLLNEIPVVPRDSARPLNLPRVQFQLAEIREATGVELKHLIAMPLVASEHRVGVIFVFRRPTAAFFSPIDEEVLAGFADHAALAIENARLYAETARTASELNRVIDESANGIVLLDARGNVRRMNRTARALTGWGDDALDAHYRDVLRVTDERGVPARLPGFTDGAPGTLEGFLQRAGGVRGAYVQMTLSPLLSDNAVTSVVVSIVDLTRLKETEAMKSTFLAGISHDLKTPLALILGYSETLRRKDVEWDRKTLEESLAIIADEAEYLHHLVNALIDAAQLETGQLPLQISRVRVDEIARKLSERFRTAFPDREWRVELPEMPPVKADPQRLREVLDNLLTNAGKYSPRATVITLGGWVESERVGIYVRDSGPGIPLGDQARIFDRFARGLSAQARRTEGAGLGLYLCKAIVEQHGGKIWVENMPERGAAFYFTLPRFQGVQNDDH